jgi:hypothetical protein
MFVPSKPFLLCLIFASKGMSNSTRGLYERCSNWVGSGLTHKERLEGDKRTSLLVLGIDDDEEKMFHNISARFGSFSTSATIRPYPFTRKPIFDVRHSPVRETDDATKSGVFF